MDDQIFEMYFSDQNLFRDCFVELGSKHGIDVIVPIINTNPLFERNLSNFYDRIPISRLLIGNGGVTDDSLEILARFPRVTIFDHTGLETVGGSIVELIRQVTSEDFIYLHADVFLPEGWFECMSTSLQNFDWVECPQLLTVMVQFWNDPQNVSERAYSGAQIGRRSVLLEATKDVEDDFLQRTEDVVIAELVGKSGGRYGRALETFHYHQVMNKKGNMEPDFDRVVLKKRVDEKWEMRVNELQWKSIVKYLQPEKRYLVEVVQVAVAANVKLGGTSHSEVLAWIGEVNPAWLPAVRKTSIKRRLANAMYRAGYRLRSLAE